MNFTESELELIDQYAASSKEETLVGLKEIVSVLEKRGDFLTKAIAEHAIEKLEKIPEPECRRFLSDNRAHFWERRDSSIRQRLDAARAQTREPVLLGHGLMGAERFMPEARHMVIVDILNNDGPVGCKGERYRFFLSDEGYKNAKASERRGEVKIRSHAAVAGGKLYYDRMQRSER